MNILYLADAHSSHTKKFVDYFLGKGHEVSVFRSRQEKLMGQEFKV